MLKASKYKHPISLLFSNQQKKDANNGTIFYHFFNKKLCSRHNCHQKHACKTYGLKNYSSKVYKKSMSPNVSTGGNGITYWKWQFSIKSIKIINNIPIDIRNLIGFLSNFEYLFILIRLNTSIFF